MNNAEFAIPGLMPVHAFNYTSQLILPEDGSMNLCVHCGKLGDDVNYAIYIPGWAHGVIKDPSYRYGNHEQFLSTHNYPQLLTISDTLPDESMVPVRSFHGIPIPITERPEIAGKDKLYWILQLPINSLPQGDTEVQLVINGKMVTYHVQRPTFAIHCSLDVTSRYEDLQVVPGELLDMSFIADKPHDVILDLVTCCGEDRFSLPTETSYMFALNMHETTTPLTPAATDTILTTTIPAELAQEGTGTWTVHYSIFDNPDYNPDTDPTWMQKDWIYLSGGQITFTPNTSIL